jgi:RND family efflux transporter MFP subunit
MNRGLALLASSVLLAGCGSHEEEKENKPVVAVKLAVAELADVSLLVRAPALVHPRQQASIASRLTAVIRELPVGKGDRVAKGAVLAMLDDRDLAAQRADAAAALHQAEVTAERRARLFEEGAVPQRDLLASQTEAAQMKARLELIETQLEFSRLVSPFAGTITEQFLYPGDMAKPDSPVFTVMDVSIAVARGQVPESDAGAIRQGQACLFVPTDHAGDAFHGRVSVVTRAVDPGRRTVEAWCEIENASGRLLPGAFGELRVVIGMEPKSVVVPLEAIQFEEGTKKGSVVVPDAQRVAHRKEVLVGEIFDGKAQIKEGLGAGDEVVVEGGYSLADGTSVRVEEKEKDEPEAGGKEKDEK